jgi:hypothetical protein
MIFTMLYMFLPNIFFAEHQDVGADLLEGVNILDDDLLNDRTVDPKLISRFLKTNSIMRIRAARKMTKILLRMLLELENRVGTNARLSNTCKTLLEEAQAIYARADNTLRQIQESPEATIRAATEIMNNVIKLKTGIDDLKCVSMKLYAIRTAYNTLYEAQRQIFIIYIYRTKETVKSIVREQKREIERLPDELRDIKNTVETIECCIESHLGTVAKPSSCFDKSLIKAQFNAILREAKLFAKEIEIRYLESQLELFERSKVSPKPQGEIEARRAHDVALREIEILRLELTEAKTIVKRIKLNLPIEIEMLRRELEYAKIEIEELNIRDIELNKKLKKNEKKLKKTRIEIEKLRKPNTVLSEQLAQRDLRIQELESGKQDVERRLEDAQRAQEEMNRRLQELEEAMQATEAAEANQRLQEAAAQAGREKEAALQRAREAQSAQEETNQRLQELEEANRRLQEEAEQRENDLKTANNGLTNQLQVAQQDVQRLQEAAEAAERLQGEATRVAAQTEREKDRLTGQLRTAQQETQRAIQRADDTERRVNELNRQLQLAQEEARRLQEEKTQETNESVTELKTDQEAATKIQSAAVSLVEDNKHTKLFVAVTIAGFLICGFGLFMMLTNYIVFDFVNMISPCLAGLGFGVAIVCLIKLCYNYCASTNSCSGHQEITLEVKSRVAIPTDGPPVNATDLLYYQ